MRQCEFRKPKRKCMFVPNYPSTIPMINFLRITEFSCELVPITEQANFWNICASPHIFSWLRTSTFLESFISNPARETAYSVTKENSSRSQWFTLQIKRWHYLFWLDFLENVARNWHFAWWKDRFVLLSDCGW